MQMLLDLTLMYDADLCLDSSHEMAARYKYVSLQHWSVATSLFSQILAQLIPPMYRDAI